MTVRQGDCAPQEFYAATILGFANDEFSRRQLGSGARAEFEIAPW
jgi:hypothetical protein